MKGEKARYLWGRKEYTHRVEALGKGFIRLPVKNPLLSMRGEFSPMLGECMVGAPWRGLGEAFLEGFCAAS